MDVYVEFKWMDYYNNTLSCTLRFNWIWKECNALIIMWKFSFGSSTRYLRIHQASDIPIVLQSYNKYVARRKSVSRQVISKKYGKMI